MQPTKRSSDPDIPNHWSDQRPKNFCCQSPCPIIPDDAAMSDMCFFQICISFFNIIFMSDNPKLMRTTWHTKWVARQATQDLSLAEAVAPILSMWGHWGVPDFWMLWYGDSWEMEEKNHSTICWHSRSQWVNIICHAVVNSLLIL